VSKISGVVTELHAIHRFHAVVSFTEYGLYPAAIIAKELNIKGNHVHPVACTRDKIKMRELLNENQLSTVTYQHCKSIEEVILFYKNIKSPFILKPFDGAGSCGVSYVDSPDQIPKAWQWASQGGHCCLAEEYLPGKEFSVESISFNGRHEIISITEKITTGSPHFIELGHQTPARLNNQMIAATTKLIINFLTVIQQWNGPVHTEIKINNDEIKIIESQTRTGGDQIWELTEMTTGVDMISETLAHLLDIKAPGRKKYTEAAAIRFFVRENEEIINVNGEELAVTVPGVVRINCTLRNGLKLGKLTSSESRQGYVLGSGLTIQEAILAVENAMNSINIISLPFKNSLKEISHD
jgi:biotin carboxylase